jgi:hypothetical protein
LALESLRNGGINESEYNESEPLTINHDAVPAMLDKGGMESWLGGGDFGGTHMGGYGHRYGYGYDDYGYSIGGRRHRVTHHHGTSHHA